MQSRWHGASPEEVLHVQGWLQSLVEGVCYVRMLAHL